MIDFCQKPIIIFQPKMIMHSTLVIDGSKLASLPLTIPTGTLKLKEIKSGRFELPLVVRV